MLEYGPESRVDCQDGHLYRSYLDGWYFWHSKGLVRSHELINNLAITAPKGDFDPERYQAFLIKMRGHINNLLTQGGVISADGSIVEFSLSKVQDLSELVARAHNTLAARFEAGVLKDRYGITYGDSSDRKQVIYYLAPGIRNRLRHRVNQYGQMYMGVVPAEGDEYKNFDEAALEYVLVRAVPNFVVLQESSYGVIPVYTSRAITRAALVDLTKSELAYQFRA